MTDVELIMPERYADIGQFRVGKLFPYPRKGRLALSYL